MSFEICSRRNITDVVLLRQEVRVEKCPFVFDIRHLSQCFYPKEKTIVGLIMNNVMKLYTNITFIR